MEKIKTEGMKDQAHYSSVKAINITKCQLTTSEKSVLNKGLNFVVTIKWIPYLDLIAPIEEAASKIPKTWADELRRKVRQALKKSKLPKPNISKEERLTI